MVLTLPSLYGQRVSLFGHDDANSSIANRETHQNQFSLYRGLMMISRGSSSSKIRASGMLGLFFPNRIVIWTSMR